MRLLTGKSFSLVLCSGGKTPLIDSLSRSLLSTGLKAGEHHSGDRFWVFYSVCVCMCMHRCVMCAYVHTCTTVCMCRSKDNL